MATPGRFADGGGGLYLQVRSAENKSWLFRDMLGGKAREMGLGPMDLVTWAEPGPPRSRSASSYWPAKTRLSSVRPRSRQKPLRPTIAPARTLLPLTSQPTNRGEQRQARGPMGRHSDHLCLSAIRL